MRMATLSKAGRIQLDGVNEEIGRLRAQWALDDGSGVLDALVDQPQALDLFDRMQLEAVIHVCRRSRSLSAAGRELFSMSRSQRTSTNDADRLRKYLARFGLDWAAVMASVRPIR